jgi:hypothetical protein
MAFQIHRLTEKTVFVHEVLRDAAQLEGLLSLLQEIIPDTDRNGAWLCTDADGREGFHVWREEGGIVGDQYGVAFIFQCGLKDRFADLRGTLGIGIRNDLAINNDSGKFADVEFLKTTKGWFW